MGNLYRTRYRNSAVAVTVNTLALSAVLLLVSVSATAQNGKATSVLVETTALSMQSVQQSVNAYGPVEPDPDSVVVISLPRAGLITKVLVRQGERIAAGDALLVLDTAPDTRLQFVQATAAQQYAEGQLDRTRQLFAERLATRDQVASAERTLRDAEAQVAALRSVGANQGRQTIRSDSDGIVTSLSISAGDRTAADSPAIILAQSSGLIVRLGIEPEDARRIPDNSAVDLISVFQPDIRISTHIAKINSMINPATRLVDAIAPIPDPIETQIILGMTMRANITLQQDVLPVLPRSAMLRDSDGAYVFVVRNNQAHRIGVEVVFESTTEVGISSELEEGAIVVVSGNYELRDGMAVREQTHAGN